jgi:hypothetical protein
MIQFFAVQSGIAERMCTLRAVRADDFVVLQRSGDHQMSCHDEDKSKHLKSNNNQYPESCNSQSKASSA